METRAVLRGVRLSADKGRLVADLIRGKKVEQALNILAFTPKKAAVIVKKVLESAVANAEHNDSADIDELRVTSIYIEQGTTLKRFTARAKGRFGIGADNDRITYADKFPTVTVDVRVENRMGQPLVGLTENNFFLTESNRQVNDFALKGAAYLNTDCDIAVVVERSPQSEKEIELVRTVIREFAEAMQGKGTVSIVSASQLPVLEGKFSPETLISQPLKLKAAWSPVWNCDLALRLATGELINAAPKRAIVFLSFEDIGSDSFKQYSLNDLAAYMTNNGIRFYAVNLRPRTLPAELAYLCVKTGGESTYIYAEKGLSPIIEDLIEKPIGSYQLSYTSTLPTDFGRAYLPVEVEVRLLTRSGRDETGYFAPLE